MSMIDVLKAQHPQGIIRSFPRAFTSLVATSATAATFYTLSTGKRVILVNLGAWRVTGNSQLNLLLGEGTAGAFTQLIQDLAVLVGVNNSWSLDGPDVLPCLEFEAAITIATDAASLASPNDIRVKSTVFEF